jgi:hypothetical protein
MRDPIDKKSLKEDIESRIMTGNSKQQIYEELIPIYGERITIAEALQNIPTLERRQKYQRTNRLLLVLLSLTAAIDLLNMNSIPIPLIWDGYLIYVVAYYKVNNYLWIWFRAGLSLLLITILIISSFTNAKNFHFDKSTASIIYMGIVLLLLLTTALISYRLDKKICPEFKEKKVWFTDSNGNEKLKIVHEFID